MNSPLHESRRAHESAEREYTRVGSLNVGLAYSLENACENVVRVLYRTGTGSEFPYQQFPPHKPGAWLERIGMTGHYSTETKRFLATLDGLCLDKARYEGTQPYEQYVSPRNAPRSKELLGGTLRFIEESERLLSDHDALRAIQLSVPGTK